MQYIVSNVIAFLLSIIFAFITNKTYVFKSHSWQKDIVLKEGIAFVGTRVITFFVDMTLMIILIEIIINDFIAKCVVNAIVIVINYVISKWIIFKNTN